MIRSAKKYTKGGDSHASVYEGCGQTDRQHIQDRQGRQGKEGRQGRQGRQVGRQAGRQARRQADRQFSIYPNGDSIGQTEKRLENVTRQLNKDVSFGYRH